MRLIPRSLLLGGVIVVLAISALDAQAPAQGGRGGGTGQAPARPARDTASMPTGTAQIRGRVLAADSGQPLRRAQVMAVAPDVRTSRAAITDAEGRFALTELPAGRYTIRAEKGGYVAMVYGQRRSFEAGPPLDLADGQSFDQVDIRLPRGAVITGRLVDDTGEPVTQARVQAARSEYAQGGARRLVPAGVSNPTDDLGQFRIYGLTPGSYIVSAATMGGTRQFGPPANDGAVEDYAPTYYPGTINEADAQLVSVSLSQEALASFVMTSARLSRVSGTVIDSMGRTFSGGTVQLRAASQIGVNVRGGAPIQPDGTFTLTAVPPGDHVIEFRTNGGPTEEFAALGVTVAGDITGLIVSTTPGATVQGRVTFEGGTAKPTALSLRMAATSTSASGAGPTLGVRRDPQDGVVADDGQFQLAGVTGRVLFRAQVAAAAGSAWRLKAVLLDGADVTDVPREFKGNETVSHLTVVLTNRATEVSGTVRDARGDVLKDYVVVFIPTELQEGAVATRFTRRAQPDRDGYFHVRNLPAAGYVVAAFETLEPGGEWNPDVQVRIRASGRSATVTDAQPVRLDLGLIAP